MNRNTGFLNHAVKSPFAGRDLKNRLPKHAHLGLSGFFPEGSPSDWSLRHSSLIVRTRAGLEGLRLRSREEGKSHSSQDARGAVFGVYVGKSVLSVTISSKVVNIIN